MLELVLALNLVNRAALAVDAQLARAVDRTVTDTDSAQGAEGFLRTAGVVVIQRDGLDKVPVTGAPPSTVGKVTPDTPLWLSKVYEVTGYRAAGWWHYR